MMRPPDRHADDRMARDPREGGFHRLNDEPRAGKEISVPSECRTAIGEDFGRARDAHLAGPRGREIRGEQLEPVGRVPHQIAVDENLRNDLRLVGIESRLDRERRRELDQFVGVVDAGHRDTVLAWECVLQLVTGPSARQAGSWCARAPAIRRASPGAAVRADGGRRRWRSRRLPSSPSWSRADRIADSRS